MRNWIAAFCKAAALAIFIVISNHCGRITVGWYRKSIQKSRAGFPGTTWISLLPGEDGRFNIARSLVGSEGTLDHHSRSQSAADRR